MVLDDKVNYKYKLLILNGHNPTLLTSCLCNLQSYGYSKASGLVWIEFTNQNILMPQASVDAAPLDICTPINTKAF